MAHYEIIEGPITIAYGGDDKKGYFLSIQDSRLKRREEATEATNDLAYNLGVGNRDGDGSYFNITTGLWAGRKVSQQVYLEYLKRYGVPKRHIATVYAGAFNFS